MKEIPMLFSTPMVQALLEGRKGQTRRLVKMPKDDIADAKWGYTVFTPKGHISFRGVHSNGQYGESFVKCPYGQPGDILWVRETWGVGCRPDPFQGSVDGIEFKADSKFIDDIESLPLYQYEDFDYANSDKSGWRPSIYMPKSIARIWLQVESIRVERLQDITEEDAKAEGIEQVGICPSDLQPEYKDYKSELRRIGETKPWGLSPTGSFKSLWQSINGTESWNDNPWVWCLSFKIISTTGKPSLLTETTNNE